jgi:hypothetical protein
MVCKVIEIRDSMTHIETLAIRMLADNPAQEYGIHYRCGHPRDGSSIVLMHLDSCKATNDPYEWTALGLGPRTMPVAHNYVIAHFDEIKDGDVVDVEFILGETSKPKISERTTTC